MWDTSPLHVYPCQLRHTSRRRPRAAYQVTYRGTLARWLVCNRHAERYRGNPEFVVEPLAVTVGA